MFGKFALWLLVFILGTAGARASVADSGASLLDLKHSSWTAEQGAPNNIEAITQTPDGFLWLGTTSGLYRFDGIRFDRIPLPADNSLTSQHVKALLTLASGALLVGYDQGQLALLRRNRLVVLRTPLPSNPIKDLVQDQDGGIWVAHVGAASGVARFFHGKWRQFGPESGLPLDWGLNLSITPKGTVLFRSRSGIFVLRRGAARFESLPTEKSGKPLLVRDKNGSVWRLGVEGAAMLRRADGSAPASTVIPLPLEATAITGLSVRDGSIWITTWATGLIRFRATSKTPVEVMTAAEGLTSNLTIAAFQDREGNVWIGTTNGLDQFRPASIINERSIPTAKNGFLIGPGDHGSVLITDFQKLYHVLPGAGVQVEVLPKEGVEVVCGGPNGSVMLGASYGFWRSVDGRLEPLPAPPPPAPPATRRHLFQCLTDSAGRTWFSAMSDGVIMYDRGVWKHFPLPKGLEDHWAENMGVDRFGRPLIYLTGGSLMRFDEGGMTPIWSDAGSKLGELRTVFQAPGEILVGQALGLSRIRDGKVQSLKRPWLETSVGIAQTATDTWLLNNSGVVRIATSDLDTAFDHPDRYLPHRIFDQRDGLSGSVEPFGKNNLVASGDGRLWFITADQAGSVDPRAVTANRVKPGVVITGITVDGQLWPSDRPIRLGPGGHDLRIVFTATSLTAPSRVQFRYRMTGLDPAWKDPGAIREADFPHLGPGEYRFQVIAANDDGLWNRDGAVVRLSIRPAFYQTWWFIVLVGILVALLAYAAAMLIERQKRDRERSLLKGQLKERERIARELHDTLLQGVQAVILTMHGVATRLPSGHPERPLIDVALDRAELVAVEGRDSLRNLRPLSASIELPDAIRQTAELALANQPIALHLGVSGEVRSMPLEVCEEVRKIASEALTNVIKHANATEIGISFEYRGRHFEMRIQDNGRGFDDALLATIDPRHFGVRGMHERAHAIGAQLRIESKAGQGTSVLLILSPPTLRERIRHLIGL